MLIKEECKKNLQICKISDTRILTTIVQNLEFNVHMWYVKLSVKDPYIENMHAHMWPHTSMHSHIYMWTQVQEFVHGYSTHISAVTTRC